MEKDPVGGSKEQKQWGKNPVGKNEGAGASVGEGSGSAQLILRSIGRRLTVTLSELRGKL